MTCGDEACRCITTDPACHQGLLCLPHASLRSLVTCHHQPVSVCPLLYAHSKHVPNGTLYSQMHQHCRRDAKSLLAAPEEPYCKPIPTSWWVGGLAAAAVLATAILCPMMDMPAYEPLAAVVLTLLVAVLAVRALGMSDLNPVSGVGKLSQVCLPSEAAC